MQEAKVSASNEAEISQNILRGSCCLDESNDAVVKIRSAQLSLKALNHPKRDNQNTDRKHKRESWGCDWRCSRVAYVFGLKSSSLRCTLHTTNLRKDNTSIIFFFWQQQYIYLK
ncbi:hypothetical protein Bca4012_048223 [Brassica carinata]